MPSKNDGQISKGQGAKVPDENAQIYLALRLR
jgi:hypothetical protein